MIRLQKEEVDVVAITKSSNGVIKIGVTHYLIKKANFNKLMRNGELECSLSTINIKGISTPCIKCLEF